MFRVESRRFIINDKWNYNFFYLNGKFRKKVSKNLSNIWLYNFKNWKRKCLYYNVYLIFYGRFSRGKNIIML